MARREAEPETDEEADEEEGPEPPREAMALLAGILALGCAGGAAMGATGGWPSATLGVLYVAGLGEAVVAIALAARAGLGPRKRKGLLVPSILVCVVAATLLAGIVLLSGRV